LSIAQGLKISRMSRRLGQNDLDVSYSKSMVSMIERGERNVASDMAPNLATKLDHPALFFETAREMTGGFGPAWLIGPNVDLHRSSVREKCVEELHEAIESISRFRTAKPPSVETESEREHRKEHLLQVMDAVEACYMYVGIQCEEYGFSLLQISREHFNKLRSRRYVKS
jgi:transcriptional regulator with XRE-family HTH domain